MSVVPRILVVDHYDSYTWNLVHLLAAVSGSHLRTGASRLSTMTAVSFSRLERLALRLTEQSRSRDDRAAVDESLSEGPGLL